MKAAVINVATGPYVRYWRRLYPELRQMFFPSSNLHVHLFTDQPDAVSGLDSSDRFVSVHQIPPYRWPEATLFRYEFISSISEQIEPLDVVAYLDVDTQILRQVGHELDPRYWPSELGFVRHPGFYRPKGLRGMRLRCARPKTLLRDLTGKPRRQRALGTWETNSKSSAYVRPRDRRAYVMGAFWLGSGSAISSMCQELSLKIRHDYDRGVIATWHDESHLNAYAASHPVELLSPAYLYVENAWQLAQIEPRIMCLDKGDHDFHTVLTDTPRPR